MDNDKDKFKNEFKVRLYNWVLRLLKLINSLYSCLVNQVTGKQLLRSGTSILANYVEGKSASSRKDYANYFCYSLKSANESKVWLALLRDGGTCKNQPKNVKYLLTELDEISRILAASILTLKNSDK